MFKIKGEKKKYILNIGSLIEVYNVVNRKWEIYEIRSIRFNTPDVDFWGIPQFSNQINEIFLVRERHIPEFLEENLIRIKRL